MDENERTLRAGPAVFVVYDKEAEEKGDQSVFLQWLIWHGYKNDATGKLTGSRNPYIYINVKSHVFKHGVSGCKYISTINDRQMTTGDFKTILSILQNYETADSTEIDESTVTQDTLDEEAAQMKPNRRVCHLFQQEPKKACLGANLKLIRDYGDRQFGNRLYDWTRGSRSLYQCKDCGAYIMKQITEIDFFDDNEEEYMTLWPVTNEADAEFLNRAIEGDLARHLNRDYLQVHFTNGGRDYSRGYRSENALNVSAVIPWDSLQDVFETWTLLCYPFQCDNQIALLFEKKTNIGKYLVRLYDIHSGEQTGEYSYELNDCASGTIWFRGKSLYAAVRDADNYSTVHCVSPENDAEVSRDFSIGRNVSCIACRDDGAIAVGYGTDDAGTVPEYELAIFSPDGELLRNIPAKEGHRYTDVTLSADGYFQYHVYGESCVHIVFEDAIMEIPMPCGDFIGFSFSKDMQSVFYVCSGDGKDYYYIHDFNAEYAEPMLIEGMICWCTSTLQHYFAASSESGLVVCSFDHMDDQEKENTLGIHHCPVCGKYLFAEDDSFDICTNCGWEDDRTQINDPDEDMCANQMSLNQARELYRSGKLREH